MVMFWIVAISIPQMSWTMVPYSQVSTNRTAVTNSGETSSARYHPQAPGLKLRLLRAWWEAKDYACYGVPYLLQNHRVVLLCSGLLVLALGGVVANSIARASRSRKQAAEQSCEEHALRAAAIEKGGACFSGTQHQTADPNPKEQPK